MNLIHRRYCRSRLWHRHLSGLLPWATDGVPLAGARVLELGSGPGQSTDWLRGLVGSLTAVEYDAPDATALARRLSDVEVIHGDATALPFAAGAFDLVVCFAALWCLGSCCGGGEGETHGFEHPVRGVPARLPL